MNRNVTLDVRYVGTLSRKNYTTTEPQHRELPVQRLARRTAIESARVRKSPRPRRIPRACWTRCSTGSTSAPPAAPRCRQVRPTVQSARPRHRRNAVYQSAALQMRSSTTFQTNLANGNFNAQLRGSSALQLELRTTRERMLRCRHPGGTVGAVLRYANTKYPGQFPENFIVDEPAVRCRQHADQQRVQQLPFAAGSDVDPSDPGFQRPGHL